MNVTIDLSEQNAAALEAQARAAHMPPASYLSKIVARALHGQHPGEEHDRRDQDRLVVGEDHQQGDHDERDQYRSDTDRYHHHQLPRQRPGGGAYPARKGSSELAHGVNR